MRKIIILPFAEQDIRDSVIYYSEKETGLLRKDFHNCSVSQ